MIELELSRGRNTMGIWQDLVDRHGFTGGYQTVKRFVRTLRGTVLPEARVIIESRPGEECQVDYGTAPMVRDARYGQVPAHTAVRVDVGMESQVGTATGPRAYSIITTRQTSSQPPSAIERRSYCTRTTMISG